MGKDPFVAILLTALAFCAVCPFFATCEETILRNGIKSLSNIMIKYQANLDNKVKFVKLQEAVDVLDEAMSGYQGKAKDKLPRIRSLNSEARLTYENCVAPIFEWCISTNRTFDIFIPYIGASNLTAEDRNIIWNMTVTALNAGLEETAKSLELLTHVQYKTAELKNLFSAISHDVQDDFSPKGFYGVEKAELEAMNRDLIEQQLGVSIFVGILFGVIGTLIFGPIGTVVGFATGFAVGYGIEDLEHWHEKKTYKERIEAIDHFFKMLNKMIKDATDIVKDIESALEEDKTNLHKLRGVIDGANNNKKVLVSPNAFLQASFIPNIQDLKNQCTKYVLWHGFDAPFYQRTKSRTTRAASTICEVQLSNAKNALAKSSTPNSTEFLKISSIIDQMDCGAHILPILKWREKGRFSPKLM